MKDERVIGNNRFLVLVILLLFLPFAFAQLQQAIEKLPADVANQLDTKFKDYAYRTTKSLYDMNYFFITHDVPKTGIETWVQVLVGSIAVVILGYLGLKFMTKASGAHERTRVKSELQGVFVMIVLIAVSGILLDYILGIEQSMASVLLQAKGVQANNALLNPSASAWTGQNENYVLVDNPIVTLIYGFGLSVSAFSLALRWLYILLSWMLFPLFIFMFYVPIDFIRKTGEILLKMLALMIFIPFLDSFIIQGINLLLGAISGIPSGLLVLTFGFLMIGVFNLVLPYIVIQFTAMPMNIMAFFTRARGGVAGL